MTTYTIKQGEHSSGVHITPHFNRKCLFKTVVFNESALYNLQSDDQLDINKLFGLSYGYHHHNSVRFGWRSLSSVSNKIEILAYVYRNGKRVVEDNDNLTICHVNLNERYFFDIEVTDSIYELTVSSQHQQYHGYKTFDHGRLCSFGYQLFPYFGGNRTAPHDISIQIT